MNRPGAKGRGSPGPGATPGRRWHRPAPVELAAARKGRTIKHIWCFRGAWRHLGSDAGLIYMISALATKPTMAMLMYAMML